MSNLRVFTVPGRPRAKQRPRLTRYGVITPKETIEYERKLRDHYLEEYPDIEQFDGDLAVDLYAFYKNKSHPDLDNVIKILDGLNTVTWKDDKQIKEIHAYLVVDKEEPEQLVLSIRPVAKSFKEKVIAKVKKLISALRGTVIQGDTK